MKISTRKKAGTFWMKLFRRKPRPQLKYTGSEKRGAKTLHYFDIGHKPVDNTDLIDLLKKATRQIKENTKYGNVGGPQGEPNFTASIPRPFMLLEGADPQISKILEMNEVITRRIHKQISGGDRP